MLLDRSGALPDHATALVALSSWLREHGLDEGLRTIGQRVVHGDLHVDAERNAAHAPIISSSASRAVVRVIPTDEDLIIARHTHRLIEEGVDHGHHV